MESMVLKMRKTKDSGIEWIGEIPEGWEITKIKHIVSSVTDIDHFMPDSAEFGIPYLMIGDLKDLSSSIDWDSSKKISIEDYKKLSIKSRPQIGDIIFARYASIGTTCYIDTDRDFLVSYACLTIHPSDLIIGKFLSYYLKSSSFAEDVLRRTNSNTQGNVGKDSLVNATIVLPSIIEQTQIVNFLDAKCSDINAMLSKTRSSIEEYKKLKQAVITQAVTKGVRGEREMKDSGVEWIGEIPKEWVCEKIKYATSISRGLFNHRPRNDERYYNGKYPFIQTGDVANATKYIVSYSQTLNELGKSVSKEFPKGTLTMTIAANVGDVAILNFDAYFPDSVVGFVPNKNIRTLYLFYVFSAMKDEFIRTAIKSTQLNLNIDRVKETFIPVTLNVNEQCEIENFLESKCAEIDGLIAKKEQLVKELESYKKSLIYEVVTGKREV